MLKTHAREPIHAGLKRQYAQLDVMLENVPTQANVLAAVQVLLHPAPVALD